MCQARMTADAKTLSWDGVWYVQGAANRPTFVEQLAGVEGNSRSQRAKEEKGVMDYVGLC